MSGKFLSTRKLKHRLPKSESGSAYSSHGSLNSDLSGTIDAREKLVVNRKFKEVDNNLQQLRDLEELRMLKMRNNLLLESSLPPYIDTRYGLGAEFEHRSEHSGISPTLMSGTVIPKRQFAKDLTTGYLQSSAEMYSGSGVHAKLGDIRGQYGSAMENHRGFKRLADEMSMGPSDIDYYELKAKCEFTAEDAENDFYEVDEYVEYKIKSGSTNLAYRNLFKEFIYPQMDFVYIYDPNFIFPHHTHNLARFINLLHNRTKIKKAILETSPRTVTKSQVLHDLAALQRGVKPLGIKFEFFCVNLDLNKKPWIRFGRKWKVSLDRGLDVFVAPQNALERENMNLRRTHEFEVFAVKYASD